ncbi:hypothetical protein LO80_03370 [Candidatus Francisella endociliophora]|uniref:Uncharacterized protein n=1 Tax=Candidatus Francisella endociliophora TaxID=653937 RepID=A0A097ENF9_9GAMM|nr:hypothetical protein [Francisella sp. FSC1006]AIT09101.1 hypothetical protein LO80_03370 [Francisella sp. FSC1006]
MSGWDLNILVKNFIEFSVNDFKEVALQRVKNNLEVKYKEYKEAEKKYNDHKFKVEDQGREVKKGLEKVFHEILNQAKGDVDFSLEQEVDGVVDESKYNYTAKDVDDLYKSTSLIYTLHSQGKVGRIKKNGVWHYKDSDVMDYYENIRKPRLIERGVSL